MSARPHLEALEPRLLYSADALSLAMSLGAASFASADAAWTQAAAAPTSQDVVSTRGVEIVVLDSSVADAASLSNDLAAQQRAGRNIEVLSLNAGDDGIARITELLAQRNNISALHLLGHGTDGVVVLGGVQLNSASLLARAGEIARWGRAFSSDADLLIYGCDVAAGSTGQGLVHDLAALTGTDVAASTDTTASSLRGGNWVLEDQTGKIETASALSNAEQQNYNGSLATLVVTHFADDNQPGSLRWAITQANAAAGATTITLAAGNYVMTEATASLGNLSNDFDILNNAVTIIGAGADQTVIVSQGAWRHFEVQSGSFHLSGVTLSNGSQADTNVNNMESRGGSIYVHAGASLELSQCVIDNSSAQNGGAVFVQGSATLSEVELRNNSARQDGGAIYNEGALSLSRVTVADNTAAHDGGGIYESSTTWLNLNNVTLSGNQAQHYGGALYTSTTATLQNTSVVNNFASTRGGGIYASSAAVPVAAINSLFSGNVDGVGVVSHSNHRLISGGNNLVVNQSGVLAGATDRIVTDVKLANLAANGGIGRTHALLPGSPAINAANPSTSPSTDQRGTARQGAPDIGAYEYTNTPPVVTPLVLASTQEDIARTITQAQLLVGATDANGDPLQASNLNILTPGSGLLVPTSPADWLFTPNTNWNGTVNFSYDVSDGRGGVVSNTASLGVTPVNDAPVFVTNNLRIDNGVSAAPEIAVTDPDDSAARLTLTVSSLSGGHFVLNTEPDTTLISFTQAQVDSGQVGFVRDALGATPSYRLTATDTNGMSAFKDVSVTFNNHNLPPSIVNNTLSLSEGERVIVTNAHIKTTDADDNNGLLTISVTEFVGGYFADTADLSILRSSFLQSEVDAQQISFVHDGANTAPRYRLTVTDPSGATATSLATVNFTPVNDAPVIAFNELSITEGGSALPSINATDEDNTPDQLSFTVTSLSGGRFELIGAAGVAITQFTQAQIDSKVVRFVDGGSGAEPTYTLTVSDGTAASSTSGGVVHFTKVNTRPVFTQNELTIREGGRAVPLIAISDPDNTPEQLLITVSGLQGGYFEFNSAPGSVLSPGGLRIVVEEVVDSFTLAQYRAGHISFVHDGSEVLPGYTLTVTDTGGASDISALSTLAFAPVNDAPAFSVNRLVISEGGSAAPQILVSDVDNSAAQITIWVIDISGGRFELTSAPGQAVTRFTQWQVDQGEIRFVDNGLGMAPRYSLAAADPELLAADAKTALPHSSGNVIFTPVNDAPVFISNALTISEGDVATPTIKVTDEDNSAADLRFTVSTLAGGRFELLSAPGVAITQFSQAQLDAGAVRFVHDGSDTVPAYALSVADVEGATATSAGPVTAYTPVNEAPVFQANSLTISEGAVAIPQIRVSDSDNTPEQLQLRVSALVGGRFELLSAPAVAINQFSVAQLNAGAVRFVHDGSFDVPSYRLTLSDGDKLASSDVAVTFTRLSASAAAPVVEVVFGNLAVSATTATAATSTPTASAAKPSTTSAADLLAKRNAAADALAVEAAAAEAQAMAFANGATGLSSVSLSDVRERVVRVNGSAAASGGANSTGGVAHVGASGGAANVGGGVGGGAAELQNLLLAGDANPLDGISANVNVLDHKLFEAAQGSGEGSARNAALELAFERIREELDQGAQADGQVVAGSLVLSTSFSVGYVLWLARGGVLLASMASSIPAWAAVDPLPVLSRFKSRQGEDEDALAGPEGAAQGDKADALERLFSKAKSVFTGAEAAAQPTPPSLPVAPSTALAASPLTATEPSGVTP
jgi:predicted outer membrane repeat protein